MDKIQTVERIIIDLNDGDLIIKHLTQIQYKILYYAVNNDVETFAEIVLKNRKLPLFHFTLK